MKVTKCDIVAYDFRLYYYMACGCRRYNASSDWLIVTEL